MSGHRRERRGHIMRILRLRRLIAERKKREDGGATRVKYVEIRRVSHKAASRAASVYR